METHAAVSLISGDHRHTEGPLFACKTVTLMFILHPMLVAFLKEEMTHLRSRFPIKHTYFRVFLRTSVKAPHHDRLATSRGERNFLTLLRTRVLSEMNKYETNHCGAPTVKTTLE